MRKSTAEKYNFVCPLCRRHLHTDDGGTGSVKHFAGSFPTDFLDDDKTNAKWIQSGHLKPDFKEFFQKTGRCPFDEGEKDALPNPVNPPQTNAQKPVVESKPIEEVERLVNTTDSFKKKPALTIAAFLASFVGLVLVTSTTEYIKKYFKNDSSENLTKDKLESTKKETDNGILLPNNVDITQQNPAKALLEDLIRRFEKFKSGNAGHYIVKRALAKEVRIEPLTRKPIAGKLEVLIEFFHVYKPNESTTLYAKHDWITAVYDMANNDGSAIDASGKISEGLDVFIERAGREIKSDEMPRINWSLWKKIETD